MEEKILLTTEQAAKRLGISANKLRELAHRELDPLPVIILPGSRYHYFTEEILQDYIRDHARCIRNTYIIPDKKEGKNGKPNN